MKTGIYTLANDNVYDQLVGLLNSIEVNLGKDTAVCVIPYDNNIGKVEKEIEARPNVTLFDDKSVIAEWDEFLKELWRAHPTAMKTWRAEEKNEFHRFGDQRRFCAFGGPFDRFVYLDSDVIVFDSFAFLLERLDNYDFVVYNYQYKDPSHVFNVESKILYKVFSKGRLASEITCSGFFASKKGLFDKGKRNWILSKLKEGEWDILYTPTPDQTLLNYMIMRSKTSLYNLVLHLPPDKRIGGMITSPHFVERNHRLYDAGRPLPCIHYVGLNSKIIKWLCHGENIDIPYRDIFLYYRFLREPGKRPKFKRRARPISEQPHIYRKVWRRLVLMDVI